MADIVIYGGSFPGVAAAAKAAANTASSKTIALIVPDPVNHNGEGCCLGSIGTVGGQNFLISSRGQNTPREALLGGLSKCTSITIPMKWPHS